MSRIDLNNADFLRFAKFAADHVNESKGNKIARLPGAGEHDIKVGTDDKVRAFWRWQSSKDKNNEVRTLFRDTILGMFGKTKIDDLPPEIVAVMKKKDYGVGRPLTARRISQVCEAVKRHSAKLDAEDGRKKLNDVVLLLNGRKIETIVGANRPDGWDERVNNLASLSAKIGQAVSKLEVGESETVNFDGITMNISVSDEGKVKAHLECGGAKLDVGGFDKNALSTGLKDTLFALYDSFGDVKEDGEFTMGRAVISSKVLSFYKAQSLGELDTKNACPLRNFAAEFLIAKAGVGEEQIAKLDNNTLANFVDTLCLTGDAGQVRELVAQTIADNEQLAQNILNDINEAEGEQGIEYEEDVNGEAGDENENVEGEKVGGEQLPEVVINGENGVVGIDEIELPPEEKVEEPKEPEVDPATLPYENKAAGSVTVFSATTVANKFISLLIATRAEGAGEAQVKALNEYASENLDVLMLLATGNASAGSAKDPTGEATVESLLAPKRVAQLAKGFIDSHSNGGDIGAFTNGAVDAIKLSLKADNLSDDVKALAKSADDTLLFIKLRGGFAGVNVAAMVDGLAPEKLAQRKAPEAPELESVHPFTETQPVAKASAKKVVKFLEGLVGVSQKALEGGVKAKEFKEGSIGSKLVKAGATAPEILNDSAKLRAALEADFDSFVSFLFDTKASIAEIPFLLKPEMKRLAAKLRGLLAQTTGNASFLKDTLDLAAFSAKDVAGIKAFLRNDVALRKMAALFAVAEPTFGVNIAKLKAAAETAPAPSKAKTLDAPAKATGVAPAKEISLDALPATRALAPFASVPALRSVVAQLSDIATDPKKQTAKDMAAFLAANDKQALKVILAALENPSILNGAVAPQLRGVVRRFCEAVVRLLANEIPGRANMKPAHLSTADLNAILALFDKANVNRLERAMQGVVAESRKIVSETGKEIQKLVDKVFNLGAMKPGSTPSPYATMTPQQIKAELDKKGLDDILDEANIDPNRPGTLAFTMNVLKTYFANLKPAAMLEIVSSALRAEAAKEGEMQVEGDCRLLTGVFKKTGPLLQKMLQGLDKRVISPEYRDAFGKVLDEMKSSMEHLSKDYAEKKLQELVTASKGAITSITLGDSLGAATVGETFLCNVVFKGKKEPEQCVVKVMRKDIGEIARLEKSVFDAAAEKVPGMATSWKSQCDSIMQEFDFRSEAKNIKEAQFYQVAGKKDDQDIANHLHAMTMPKGAPATRDVLLLSKAEGKPLDKDLSEMRRRLSQELESIFEKDPVTGKWRLDGNGNMIVRGDVPAHKLCRIRYNATQHVERVFRDMELLEQAAAKWMKEAFFGSGKFHNDLHGGNMMVSVSSKKEDAITLIDFGNLMTLESGDRKKLSNMLVYTTARDTDGFCGNLFDMINAHAKTTKLKIEAKSENAAKIKAIVSSILMKGSAKSDAGYRFLAILEELRKFGIVLPEAIYGVARGLSRLQSALDDVADLVGQTHAVYNALCAEKPCSMPKTGLFSTDHIHCGFMGEVANAVITSATVDDVEKKFEIIDKKWEKNTYYSQIANRIWNLSKTKEGLDQLERELDEFYKHVVSWWDGGEDKKTIGEHLQKLRDLHDGKITEKDLGMSKKDFIIKQFAKNLNDDIVTALDEIKENTLSSVKDDPRIREKYNVNIVDGKGKVLRTEQRCEWTARLRTLPDVMGTVCDKVLDSVSGKASLAWSVGVFNIRGLMNKLENNPDMPGGHKK